MTNYFTYFSKIILAEDVDRGSREEKKRVTKEEAAGQE